MLTLSWAKHTWLPKLQAMLAWQQAPQEAKASKAIDFVWKPPKNKADSKRILWFELNVVWVNRPASSGASCAGSGLRGNGVQYKKAAVWNSQRHHNHWVDSSGLYCIEQAGVKHKVNLGLHSDNILWPSASGSRGCPYSDDELPSSLSCKKCGHLWDKHVLSLCWSSSTRLTHLSLSFCFLAGGSAVSAAAGFAMSVLMTTSRLDMAPDLTDQLGSLRSKQCLQGKSFHGYCHQDMSYRVWKQSWHHAHHLETIFAQACKRSCQKTERNWVKLPHSRPDFGVNGWNTLVRPVVHSSKSY